MQNVTAKFNIIYNANKLLQDAEHNRVETSKENYQDILPVFIEPSESSITNNASLMDSVIQKAVTIINDKSDSKYLNDAYFIMGRANYEKGNYYNAAELFTYVINTIEPKKQKLLEAALAWKCRSLIKIGYLQQTQAVLDSALRTSRIHKYPSALVSATQAEYDLQTNDLAGAIQSLTMAVKASKDYKEKIRWHYLLGQLLTKKGNNSFASKHFAQVIKSNASFEMAFNASLNNLYLKQGSGDSAWMYTVTQLKRMIKDDKNQGFTDQIYHIIGKTYLAHEKKEDAIHHFNLALRENKSNSFQKATTYLTLADLFFTDNEFETAKHYYDSAATLVNADFPNYQQIRTKIVHLDELVLQLSIIHTQDELQRLAKLTETERQQAIDSIFNRKKVKDSIAYVSKQQAPVSATFQQQANAMPATRGKESATFYFNNPSAISDGFSAFKQRWGNRSLEDNWRIQNKQKLVAENSSNTVDSLQANEDSQELHRLEEKSAFIEAIPLTDEARMQSDKKIMQAYLKLSEIYRDKLADKKAAIQAYTTLIERFPNLSERDFVWYNLYRLYSDLNDEKNQFYKTQLLTVAPHTLYAKIISDPGYLNKLGRATQTLNELYNRVYHLYTQKNYTQVISLTDSIRLVTDQENNQTMGVQLAYLKALAIGRTQPVTAFENELQQIKSHYPNDQLITPLVQEHLAYIDSNHTVLAARETALADIETDRQRFVDEPALTKWPELTFHREAPVSAPRRNLAGNLSQHQAAIKVTPFNQSVSLQGQVKVADFVKGEHNNSFRNLTLLPDSAIYYFVIHVAHPRVNLSPSRYGIGQFNRSQYAAMHLVHQLKKVDDELQLIYIGKFKSYEEVHHYEMQITEQLNAIMKIPAESYTTFIITEENLQNLSDFDQVNDYSLQYKEQL